MSSSSGVNMDEETKFRLGEAVDLCLNAGLTNNSIMALYIDALGEYQLLDRKAETEHFNNEYGGFCDKISEEEQNGSLDDAIYQYLKNMN